MLANWNSKEAAAEESKPMDNRELLNRRFIALLASALSMTFAATAGLVAKGKIPLDAWYWSIAGVVTGATVTVLGVQRRNKRKAKAAATYEEL